MIALQPVTWVSRTCLFVMSAGCQDRNRWVCHSDHQVLHQFSFCFGELAGFLLRDTAHDYVCGFLAESRTRDPETDQLPGSAVAIYSPQGRARCPFEVVGAFH